MLPTHDVPCPHCNETLYSSLSLENGMDPAGLESPKIQADHSGFYMTCPHCAKRVPLERFTAKGREAFRPAPGVSRGSG
jgi:sarcosine oxidase delta subunit